MSRIWANCRLQMRSLPTPGRHFAFISGISAVVDVLRGVDAESQWFFHHSDTEPELVADLWFHSYDVVLRDTLDRLRVLHESENPPLSWSFATRPDMPWGTTSGSGTGEALASASSDLAVELLRAGNLTAQVQQSLAIAQLRTMVSLIQAAHRPGFLFLYWQSQTAELSPAERLRVAAAADRQAAESIAHPAERPWTTVHARKAWQHYLAAARAVTAEDDGTLPVRYLLFCHLRDTNIRVGIPASSQAFAARVVRAELRAATATTAATVPELQTV
jgi:hypothetical protein